MKLAPVNVILQRNFIPIMSIEVKNLSKVYGEQKAVNGISFSVKKGEIVGFLGPNGAGKSTTMKMITGYLQPDGGEALVGGIGVAAQPMATKRKIGYLPEANPLYFDMYIREYLEFVANLHEIKNKKQKVEEVIRLTGLTPESKKKIGQLSKGYKQRVGLAAALIHDPEVLILDEPTSGLDPNQIIEIRDVIKTLGKDKTVLFSSHILQEVQALCDRVIIINKGNIVADDLLANLRRGNQQKHRVLMDTKEDLNSNIFQSLPGLLATSRHPKGSIHQWQFETEKPEELKKALLNLAVDKGFNISALQSESMSLEDVFRELTKGG